MKLVLTDFLYAISYALDAAEREVTGATVGHGKRVAALSYMTSLAYNFSNDQISDLAACALLHDNAIAEYIREEYEYDENADGEYNTIKNAHGDLSLHAYLGEINAQKIPFIGDVENAILLHHENADGTGPFKKKAEETPLYARLLHIGDVIDLNFNIENMTHVEYTKMIEFVRSNTGTLFCEDISNAFITHVTWQRIRELQLSGLLGYLKSVIPAKELEYTDAQMTHIAAFFTEIVDYKSSFTKDHSVGVAVKAQAMGKYYGFDHDKLVRFAFAGAMHDIGKMVVGNDILEKPDKLTSNEFGEMKNHALETYKILSSIKGFEDIAEWASNHHEKLDGTGYSRRLSADELSFEDRLMACIDIYQALTEKRPYKDGLGHNKSIGIMRSMAIEGKIDASIVEDLNTVFNDGKVEDDNSELKYTTKKWKCRVCGYVYEGDSAPASCPICDSDFEQFDLLDE